MPSIDEKLEVFNRMIIDDATKSRDAILSQLKAEADKKLADSRAEIDRNAAELLAKERLKATQQNEAKISKAHIDARKALMAARGEIVASVLAELRDMLGRFALEDGYGEYLANSVREAAAVAGGGNVGTGGGSGTGGYGDNSGGSGGSASNSGSNGGGGEAEILLTPSDYERHGAAIGARFQGIRLACGEASMLGGCMAINEPQGIYVDNSFSKKAEMCVGELYRISGLRIGA
ncbi:MAG: hypothetical protein LBJ10_11600 [Clostridiales bacterium]|jgi:vacuolar-type H+-ATPase subunit E/Vma4|nr:hypothetical protein [Clostridiales bacterium]